MDYWKKCFAFVLSVVMLLCYGDIAASAEESGSIHPAFYEDTVVLAEDQSLDGTSFVSSGKDENAIVVTGGNVTLANISVLRSSQDSSGGDDASFYGTGAAILSKGGTTTIQNADISTDARGGTGVFAYGDGVVKISDSTISTAQDTAGAIHAAGGGTLYATNVSASTQGSSSAAIRSDRGGGLMVIDGGSYTSHGIGSPAVYSTATIVAKEAALAATGSEAVCIEGKNSLYLYDCDLSGNMGDSDENDCTWNIILYQSMSGDAAEGNSVFQMTGGSLTAENGGMFYTTNTESTFLLEKVDITPSDSGDFFLRCTGNQNKRGWGTAGDNGADCTFSAVSQEMTGDVIWDSASKLDFYMADESVLRGAFLQDESCAGTGGGGTASLTVDSSSCWIVTGDSALTALHNAGSITDAEGNIVTIEGTDGTVYVEGSSPYTVAVDIYDPAADFSSAPASTSFEDAQVNTGSEQFAPGGANGAPGNGMPPEMPDGQEPPEMPDDQVPPDIPGNGQEPPEKPDDQVPPDIPGNGQEPPEMPGGQEPPDIPGNGQDPPEKPDESA